jgi:hypothetical protein
VGWSKRACPVLQRSCRTPGQLQSGCCYRATICTSTGPLGRRSSGLICKVPRHPANTAEHSGTGGPCRAGGKAETQRSRRTLELLALSVWRRIWPCTDCRQRVPPGNRGRSIRRRDAPCPQPAEGTGIRAAEVAEKQPTEHALEPAEEPEKRPAGHVRETVVAVLSVTALLAAWCGFEPSKWSGECAAVLKSHG